MALSSYVLPVAAGAVLMTTCWGLGRFGFSIGWIWIFVGLNFIKTKLWKSRQKRVLALRQAATREREVIMTQLQDLPAWVQFPDTERVEWMNKVINQLWPYIGEYTKQFMKEMIEPQVKASLPGPFRSFHFDQIDMGDIPLRVGGIKVYTENVGRDRIVIDMDVAYAGDCEFVVAVGAFRAGLNQMQFSGKLRAILMPLLAYPPMVGGVTAFFLDDPKIDFNLTGLGEMVELPGLMGAIRSVVTSQVRAICVLPNEIVIPLTTETDIAKLHFPEPDGVLRVVVVEARNLENRDISFIKKGKSDPYASLSVGAQNLKTATVDNNLNPVWKECFEAVVDQASGQRLQIEVFDEDAGCNDEELGRLTLEIAAIRRKGVTDEWYQLEGAKHGDLHLMLYWMELTTNPADLVKEEWEKEWFQTKTPLHPALLMVYVDNISDLPFPKHKTEPSPVVEVTLGTVTKKTYVKPKTVNPLFQQKFLFWVANPENQVIHVEAKDDATSRCLGELDIALQALLHEPKMERYQQTFTLTLGAHAAPIVMTLRLRVFRGASRPAEE
jgi:Ca2+-dependent lipid-binding protein